MKRILECEKIKFMNEKEEEIELYRSYFINFFNNKASIECIYTKKALEINKEYNIAYSKKKGKYIII